MKRGQTFVVYRGKCPVDKDRQGNTKIGNVDLSVLSIGYHMCMLIAHQPSKNWPPAKQQYVVSNFVKKVDSFLTPHFDIESRTILTACINDNLLKFVAEINEETKLETEASRVKRLTVSNAKSRARMAAKQESMTTVGRDASNAKKRAHQESMTTAEQEASNAKSRAGMAAKWESMTTAEQEAYRAKERARNRARKDAKQNSMTTA